MQRKQPFQHRKRTEVPKRTGWGARPPRKEKKMPRRI